jgi:hypothetical protein
MTKRPAKKAAKARYIPYVPRKVAEGWYFVHNRVIPQYPIGANGFRVWLTNDRSRLVKCSCGFAPELTHYRVKGTVPATKAQTKHAEARRVGQGKFCAASLPW